MVPTIKEAEELLKEAEPYNPGLWVNHSQIAAFCAMTIASCYEDMDSEKAYVLGLLHDIGRRFGTRHMGHVYDGYHYMTSLGYDEVARVCLTHSFSIQEINTYIGKVDVTDQEYDLVKHALSELTYDDYDRLIQLCDALADAQGVVNVEVRMADVKKRYGCYPPDKWNKTLELKAYFDKKTGHDIYSLLKPRMI